MGKSQNLTWHNHWSVWDQSISINPWSLNNNCRVINIDFSGNPYDSPWIYWTLIVFEPSSDVLPWSVESAEAFIMHFSHGDIIDTKHTRTWGLFKCRSISKSTGISSTSTIRVQGYFTQIDTVSLTSNLLVLLIVVSVEPVCHFHSLVGTW